MPKTMKNHIDPEIEVVEVKSFDVITTSLGTETPKYDENDGTWDLKINI